MFQKAKVLLVDDIPLNRELIQNYFVKTPIDFIEASNGKEALKLAQEHHPDLILMDLKMPQMTGYEATKKLKAMAETADIPIIALTASGMVHEEKEAKDYGFDGYLRKPVLKRDLLKEMAPFLAHEAELRAKAKPAKAERLSKTLALPDLQILHRELAALNARWDALKDSLELDEIESFAETMVVLGKRFEQYFIIDLGDSILEASQQFAMDKVSTYLAEFPQLLLQLSQWEESFD